LLDSLLQEIMLNQENFLCVACPTNPHPQLPSFSTFKEIRAHSLQVHGVQLEAAVQSATVLPDNLAMFLCLLCAPHKREVFITETSVKHHLESHSSFFLRNWNEFVEIQCRICECVIPLEIMEKHVNEVHPSNLFANIDFVKKNFEEVCKSEGNEGSISHSVLETSPHNKTCQASQPVSKNAKLLWDECFKPDQLISKNTKLLPPKIEEKTLSSLNITNKPRIRIKPLSLLQAQVEKSVSPPHLSSSRSPVSHTQAVSSCSSLCSNYEGSLSYAAPKRGSISRGSSIDRTLPPSRTWWSSKLNKNLETKADCFVCGKQFAKNKLCFHIQDHHRGMLFKCMMEPCSRKRDFFKKSTFLFPNQLNHHHQDYHKLNKNTGLDLRPTMTVLPASLVKISCSKCPKFMLSSDVSLLSKHVELEHRDTRAYLLYNCRVCEKRFNSVEEVVEHCKTHRSKKHSHTELNDKEWCQSRRHYSRGRRIITPRRSPNSNSSSSSHDKYLGERPRKRSRSPSRTHLFNNAKRGRWSSPNNIGWRSARSSSRWLHADRSRSSSRNDRGRSRTSRRPSRSRSRSTVSSVRSRSVARRLSRSKSIRCISPCRSSYSIGRRLSSGTSKHSKKDSKTRSRGRESWSRSPSRSSRSSRSQWRLGRRKSPSSSSVYFSYRARY